MRRDLKEVFIRLFLWEEYCSIVVLWCCGWGRMSLRVDIVGTEINFFGFF